MQILSSFLNHQDTSIGFQLFQIHIRLHPGGYHLYCNWSHTCKFPKLHWMWYWLPWGDALARKYYIIIIYYVSASQVIDILISLLISIGLRRLTCEIFSQRSELFNFFVYSVIAYNRIHVFYDELYAPGDAPCWWPSIMASIPPNRNGKAAILLLTDFLCTCREK